jgi:hypothetical protein
VRFKGDGLFVYDKHPSILQRLYVWDHT